MGGGGSVRGGLHDREPPGQRPTWAETPLGRDTLDREPARTETNLGRDPCGQRPPQDRDPSGQRPPPGHVTCDACWERYPHADRQTPVKTLPCPKLDFRFVPTASPKSLDPLQLDVELLHSIHFQVHFE